jgi:hypothetical protein
MFLDNGSATINPRRVETAKQSHAWLRSFTDDDFRAAAAKWSDAPSLARYFRCTTKTVRQHAVRLGIRLRATSRVCWTSEEDALVKACAEGKTTIAAITKKTGHASYTIRQRAKRLGVVLVVKEPPLKGPSTPGPKREWEYAITVGKVDRLLQRLFAEFGSPRNEVYPGSVSYA